ncbi:MAG TPA: response regulator [Ramlibacter sp.]|nr:response regulator [Ramlibacter sp.]
MNVLIVDDNEAAADLLRELLALQDHAAHCTYTARQAMEAFAAQAFDAALVDMILPDLPGIQLARRLRDMAAERPLMLVAISGMRSEDVDDADGSGLFDHFLQKPIDFDALERILGACASS